MMPSLWDRIGDLGELILFASAAYVAIRTLRGRQAESKAAKEPNTKRKGQLLSDAAIHLALATYQRQGLLYAILAGIALKLVGLIGRNFL
jgi:hypothetical protein